MKMQDPFRNSELDRAKPKRHIFHSFINNRLKRHRSDTGLVEDRTSSVTIVRIIVGLLMIHLIIIGGVLLRGQMVREGSNLAAPSTITPPPSPLAPPPAAAPVTANTTPTPTTAPQAATQQQAQHQALPQPTAPAVAPTRPAITANHITQAAQDDESAVEVEDEPEIVAPVVNQAATPQQAPAEAPTAPAEPTRHRVAPGDTLYRIANQYGTTEAALRAANPSLAQRGILRAGSTIIIPTAGGQQSTAVATTPTRTAAAPQQATTTAKTYTVKSGDTLSSISRQTGVSVQELMRINSLRNANRIHPGMQLRLKR